MGIARRRNHWSPLLARTFYITVHTLLRRYACCHRSCKRPNVSGPRLAGPNAFSIILGHGPIGRSRVSYTGSTYILLYSVCMCKRSIYTYIFYYKANTINFFFFFFYRIPFIVCVRVPPHAYSYTLRTGPSLIET